MSEAATGEKTFFEDTANEVRITSTRAIMRNKTYPMTNISSVSIGTTPANRSAAGCLALLGVLAVFSLVVSDSKAMPLLGAVVFVALAVAAWKAAKPMYSVRIGASGGETDGLTTTNKELVGKIVDAISDAIVERG